MKVPALENALAALVGNRVWFSVIRFFRSVPVNADRMFYKFIRLIYYIPVQLLKDKIDQTQLRHAN